MMIEIKEVKTKRDIKRFVGFPIRLYKNCPYYVPSIRGDEINIFNPEKNASLKENVMKAFLCYKNGKLVGRIAGLINKTYNQISGKKLIRFSRFECIDDLEVFKALLGAVEEFGLEYGMDTIHGPWGFNDTDREGMLTYGFDQLSTYATNYYYPYFYQNMQKLGFADESKWLERRFVVPKESYKRIDDLAVRIKEKYQLVDISDTMSIKQILEEYGDKFFDTMTQAYQHLDGYVPIVGKARQDMLDQFASIVNPNYISILIDKNDNVAAFGITFASICKPLVKSRGRLFPFGFIGVLKSIKKPNALEMALIGVRNEYKNAGMNAVIMSKILKNIIRDDIQIVESNPMLETNLAIQQQWKFTENEIVKKRQTYIKPIGSLIKQAEKECATAEV